MERVDQQYLENIQKRLGKRINKLRIHAGYKSQSEFSKAYSGSKTSSWVGVIESGSENLTFNTLVRLANTMHMPLRCLMDLRSTETIIIENKYHQNLKERLAIEKQRFGENLEKIRKAKGMTLLDVDIATGISKAYLSQYENGKRGPGFDSIVLLCSGLKSPLLDLFPL